MVTWEQRKRNGLTHRSLCICTLAAKRSLAASGVLTSSSSAASSGTLSTAM